MRKETRHNVQMVGEALLLLAVVLGVFAYFSHKALRDEGLRNAEQTLEGTMQHIDNILLSVEQATGNIYYDMLQHLDEPERMYTYSRELVLSNPYIDGCAICFKPGYYPGKDLFMAYVHHKKSAHSGPLDLIVSESFTRRPYTEQRWYTKPMESGWIGWIDPLKGEETEKEPLVSFCLPFADKRGERIGVIAVDVAVSQLSKVVLTTKPSENGYCTLLGHNGSYIVHPDKEKLMNPAIFSQMGRKADSSEFEAAKAMLAGKSGMKEFRRDGADWWVFYKPFKPVQWEGRSSGEVAWSVGVVYPEDDIFGLHNMLIYLAIVIGIAGILLFSVLSNWIIRKQMKPVSNLAKSAQHVADGNYNEMLPYDDRSDEIGLLHRRFKKMQQSLQRQVDELEEEKKRLQQRGYMLQMEYDRAVESDNMKTSFQRYITQQMNEPTDVIDSSVTTLCNNYHDISKEEAGKQVDNIQRKSQIMVGLLDHLAHFSESEAGKEDSHE